MDIVFAESGLHSLVSVGEGGEIIYVCDFIGGSIGTEAGIELAHACAEIGGWIPRAMVAGEQGAEHDFYAVKLGKFAHRIDVACSIVDADVAVVAGQVVDTAQNDDHFGIKSDDVLAKSYQQLRGCLSAYASAEVAVFGEEGAVPYVPHFDDGVAEKYGGRAEVFCDGLHANVARVVFIELEQFGLVLFGVAAEICPVALLG